MEAGGLEAWVSEGSVIASSVTSTSEEFAFGTVSRGTPGNSYRLCWGSDSTVAENIELDSDAELHGPQSSDSFGCTLGYSCALTISGAGFTNDNNVIVIHGGSCETGTGTAFLSTPTKEVSSTATSLVRTFTAPTFAAAAAAAGVNASYKLCWGSAPTGAGVDTYPIEIDATFEVVGPSTSSLACTLGYACSLTLAGYGLTADNRVVLVESSRTDKC